jgi:curved DNA-binding protein CbpA
MSTRTISTMSTRTISTMSTRTISTMTSERPDLYAILDVSPTATQDEISHAYRSLLRRHHPDTRSPADESQSALSDAALEQVLAAYTVLHDRARRAHYDREVRRRSQPSPRQRPQPLKHDRAYGQPPIVAGPVRWHRATDPPPP